MLRVGQAVYKLCLLDTNAVSAMLKDREGMFKCYLEWSEATRPMHVPSFSMFTVLELRQSPAVYEQFLEVFDLIPCVLLKSFDQLVAEEVVAYPDPSEINPCLHGFGGKLAKPGLAAVLGLLFETEDALADERKWNEARPEVVEGITSLVSNYLPDGDTYTAHEVRTFLEIAGFSQIAMRARQFAQKIIERGESVNIDAFPSVKAATFTVFHKFYADRTRRPSHSDVYDIIISAAVPYVEAVVTENHQAEVLRKTMRRDAFIEHLQVFALRDFRQPTPS
jgi:hypothetical protein